MGGLSPPRASGRMGALSEPEPDRPGLNPAPLLPSGNPGSASPRGEPLLRDRTGVRNRLRSVAQVSPTPRPMEATAVFLLEGSLEGGSEGRAPGGACSSRDPAQGHLGEAALDSLEHVRRHHSSTPGRGGEQRRAQAATLCGPALGASRGTHTGETRWELRHRQPERSGRYTPRSSPSSSTLATRNEKLSDKG